MIRPNSLLLDILAIIVDKNENEQRKDEQNNFFLTNYSTQLFFFGIKTLIFY